MNWNLLGHDWAAELLGGQLARNGARHAYLFTGPQGVGRRTLALKFAQALNCTQPPEPGQFCGVCAPCKQIAAQAHPDLTITQADPPGGTLKVEQIRELQRGLALAPYAAQYRIALLLRFEEANDNAANALLKTLEEPNPRVILLLTTITPESLLPTITSRCEIIRLRPIGLGLLSQGLQTRWGIPAPEAELLAHLSGGRPGYAHHLHQHPEALEQRTAWLDEHVHLLPATRVARFKYAEKLASDKPTLQQALEIWASWWRDVLLVTSGAASALTNLDRTAEITDVAARLSPGAATNFLRRLETSLTLLDKNINARLATETLMLDLPRLR